jgi:hypothetical protein
MISKSILFLCAALMLANCCALGSNCGPTSGAPVAWDGLGSAPTDNAQSVEPPPPPKKHARANREIIIGPLNPVTADQTKVRSKEQWEQDLAADRDDDASLQRKLKICSTC